MGILSASILISLLLVIYSLQSNLSHQKNVREQQARGRLERQNIEDKAANEVERKQLLEVETKSASIASTGTAKAEAKARSEAAQLEGNANVQVARTRAEAGRATAGQAGPG